VLTCRHFTAGWFHPFETWAKLSSWFSTRLWTALLFAYHTGMVILICSLDVMFIGFDPPPSLMMCFHVKLDDASQCVFFAGFFCAAMTTCIAGKLMQDLSCCLFLLIMPIDSFFCAAMTTCIVGKLIQDLSCCLILLIKPIDAFFWATLLTCQAGWDTLLVSWAAWFAYQAGWRTLLGCWLNLSSWFFHSSRLGYQPSRVSILLGCYANLSSWLAHDAICWASS